LRQVHELKAKGGRQTIRLMKSKEGVLPTYITALLFQYYQNCNNSHARYAKNYLDNLVRNFLCKYRYVCTVTLQLHKNSGLETHENRNFNF
jgi:hypothetical protein